MSHQQDVALLDEYSDNDDDYAYNDGNADENYHDTYGDPVDDDPVDDTEDCNNEYVDDDEQVIHDLLYRCRCKWKGGLQCLDVFDDEDSMWDHLVHDHKTAKWLVQLYRPV